MRMGFIDMYTLYSNNCRNCDTLKRKLDGAGIEYTLVTDREFMLSKGFNKMPVLEVTSDCDGETITRQYLFSDALNLLKKR